MKDVAEALETVVRQQLAHIQAASDLGPLSDEKWEAVAHMARVVRTLAVHQIRDEVERAPELSTADIARALRELADGKL